MRIVKRQNFVTSADIDFILPVRNVDRLTHPKANFAVNAVVILNLLKRLPTQFQILKALSQPLSIEKPTRDIVPIVGERKHVTVLFSDLTGYTAMSEKLDPEEVK